MAVGIPFEWDEHNERKVLNHGLTPGEAMEAMPNDPLFQYEQQAADEERELYYSETRSGRMLAIAVSWRGERLRIVTAYDLDASQIRDYLQQRLEQL